MKYVLCLFLFVCSLAVNAGTTIYKCKNAQGKFVFQQQPFNEVNVAGNTKAHQVWKQLKSLTNEGRGIITSLGADVASIRECKSAIDALNRKINALESDVRSLSSGHPHIYKAFGYLKDCTVCQTSAEANCRMAEQLLDQALTRMTQY